MENFIKCDYLPDGYLVNKLGQIKTARGKIMKQSLSNSGYLFVNIKGKGRFIHRAICFAFIKMEEGKNFVHHKDGNKLNNELSNLEWCTKSYNTQHAYDSGLKKYKPLHYKGKFGKEHNRSIKIICNGVEYFGYSEASRIFNVDAGTIHYRVNSSRSKWDLWKKVQVKS
jgi:NADH:ubiquinone oxidoreductase subunit